MWRELRFAFRTLLRSPGYSAAAIVILALGIGATSAIFTLVKAVLLDALPYHDPAQLVLLRGEARRDGVQPMPLSYLDIEAVAADRSSLQDVVPVTGARSFNLLAGDEAENLLGELSGAEYLRVLGTALALGRMYTADEARPPGARVVVLSHGLWQRRFGARNDVLGTTIRLNELPYTVIGVAAPGFSGLSDNAQLWLPIGLASPLYGEHYTGVRQFRWLSGIARLRTGVTFSQAGTALDALGVRLQREFAADNKDFVLRAQLLTDAYLGGIRTPLWSLLAAAAFVLLIACTNVANLLLARSAARRREFAVRVALGAGSSRLVRQVLTESAVLVAFGAAIGLLLAVFLTRALVSSGAFPLQSFMTVRVDPLVVTVTIAASLISALLFGLVPAVSATRIAPLEGIKEGSKGATMGRARRAFQRSLVGAQVALAFTLLVGAGLMTKGLQRFLDSDLGFRADSLLTMRIDLTAERYSNNEQVWSLVRRIREEAIAIPGVHSVVAEGPGYPTSGWYQISLRPSEAAPEAAFGVRRHHVTPDYFATMGVRLLAGRDFGAEDAGPSDSRSVLVSRKLAERAWPNQNPVGKTLLTIGATPVTLNVIGMVSDVEHGGLQTGAFEQADIYLSLFQSPPRSPALLTLIVRTGSSTGGVLPALQATLRRADSNLALYDVQSMQARLDAQTATGRFLVALMTSFAALGLLLAAVGVYAVVAYTVAQRTREVGIRMALGAGRTQVVGEVVRHGLAPVVAGNAIGLLAVWYLQRFVTALLYGVSPLDPITLSWTVLLLLLVAVAASGLPALRAARVHPLVALRQD